MDNEILKKAEAELYEFLKQGINFAKEQIPPLVNEIIKYNIFKDLANIVLLLVIASLFLWLVVSAHKNVKRERAQCEREILPFYVSEGDGYSFAFGYPALAIITVSIFIQVSDLGKAYFAPRLYLLDYVSERLNNKN